MGRRVGRPSHCPAFGFPLAQHLTHTGTETGVALSTLTSLFLQGESS